MTKADCIRIGIKTGLLLEKMSVDTLIYRWLDAVNKGALEAEDALDMLLEELEVDRLLLETDKRVARRKCD